MIIEEGLPFGVLDRVLGSIAAAAGRAQVRVVAGDTKVVPRGAADGLFITSSGIGEILPPVPPGPAALQPGDELIVSGPIGRHGISILAARENLGFDPPPVSDCGPLFDAVDALRKAAVPIRCLRDATRGGLAAVLRESAKFAHAALLPSPSGEPWARSSLATTRPALHFRGSVDLCDCARSRMARATARHRRRGRRIQPIRAQSRAVRLGFVPGRANSAAIEKVIDGLANRACTVQRLRL